LPLRVVEFDHLRMGGSGVAVNLPEQPGQTPVPVAPESPYGMPARIFLHAILT